MIKLDLVVAVIRQLVDKMRAEAEKEDVADEIGGAMYDCSNMVEELADNLETMVKEAMCKRCDGDGEIQDQYTNGEWARSLSPCPDCGGTGRAQLPLYERLIKLANETTDEQLEATLREAAGKIGPY